MLARVVEWDLVSCSILVVEHLCRLDAPIFMTWREMVKAWPSLRDKSGAKEAWLRVREDLVALGVEAEWGQLSLDALEGELSEDQCEAASWMLNLLGWGRIWVSLGTVGAAAAVPHAEVGLKVEASLTLVSLTRRK